MTHIPIMYDNSIMGRAFKLRDGFCPVPYKFVSIGILVIKCNECYRQASAVKNLSKHNTKNSSLKTHYCFLVFTGIIELDLQLPVQSMPITA
jgi:hypothetical protein